MPSFIGAAKSPRHGNEHAKARRLTFAQLPEWTRCCRCGEWMWKCQRDTRGKSALHYDHDNDNSSYLGFSHAWCNVKAGARKGR
jgi:hypothetical protein